MKKKTLRDFVTVTIDPLKFKFVPPPPPLNLCAFRGRLEGDTEDHHYLIDAQPGKGPGGTCGIEVLARVATFEELLSAADKFGAAPREHFARAREEIKARRGGK